MMNVRRFIGNVVAIASGIMLCDLGIAAYNGSRDAKLALLTVAAAAVLLEP